MLESIGRWGALALGALVAGGIIGVFVLGLGAVSAGFDNVAFTAGATGLMGVAGTLAASGVAATAVGGGVWTFQKQVIEKDRRYPEALAAVFGVPIGVVLDKTIDDRLTAVLAAVVFTAAGYVACLVLKKRAVLGLALYVTIAASAAAAVIATDTDVIGWLSDLGLQDWLTLVCIAVLVIALPATVAAIEAGGDQRDRWLKWLPRRKAQAPAPTSRNHY